MTNCKFCKNELPPESQKCLVCEFPVSGTEQEQSLFIAKQVSAKVEVKDARQKIKNSRWVLICLGVFYMVIPLTPLFLNPDVFSQVLTFLVGGFFLVFGLLSYKIPKVAFLVPLILIVLYNLLILMLNPEEMLNGLTWRVFVLVGIGYGYFSATKAQKLLKKYRYISTVLEKETQA